jgi:YD repeat-containing protein
MQYLYTAGKNNGRISQSVDGVLGQTVNYTYDSLNRLSTAQATNGSWGQSYSYDGFGNLTSKTVTAGSAMQFSASYAAATNHQNGVSYDAKRECADGAELHPVYL